MAEKLSSAVQQIGRYRIIGELGRGGMGVVYRGEDPLIGRDVAIKTLTQVTPELRERFYLEARSGILGHPNIVTIYELGEHEGNPFIAMEYVAGESLEKILRRVKRVSPLEALSIVEQLCAGLGYAHGQGVVHRDVKPANVLVRPDGRVTIVDFGIARLADQTRRLTKTDALLGSFHYIAPERLQGEECDNRTDIWSTGVMFYEMLTGELPFRGQDISALYRVIHEPYVPLEELVEDLPQGLSQVVAKALAKRVEDRYETAEEMALDLQMVSSPLKQERVKALLETARRLAAMRQFVNARTILLQAQRADPGNLDTRALIEEVQDRLGEMQRGEQLRQIVEQAQISVAERRWDDAIQGLERARKMDTENRLGLDEQLHEVQEQKRQQQKVAMLWEQAREARSRGDLTGAQEFLGQALQIDEHSTDLRNAYALILREIRRREESLHVEELLRAARDHNTNRQYSEALARLREAAEIEPGHPEVQELLFAVATRQKEAQRQEQLEKVANELQGLLDREEFAEAQDCVRRALQTLPGEGSLLRLKVEVESRKRDFETRKAVRAAILKAQELFVDHPEESLKVIQEGLERAPNDETLLRSRARLEGHLRGIARDAARREALLKAHGAIETQRYFEARNVLEEAIRVLGSDPDFEHLLALTLRELAQQEPRQAGIPEPSAIRVDASPPEPASAPDFRVDPEPSPRRLERAFGARPRSALLIVSQRFSRRQLLWLGAALMVVAIAAGVLVSLGHRATPANRAVNEAAPVSPAAPPLLADMEINASPWARVVEVQDAEGKTIPLPGETTTPLRLENVKAGQYKVTLRGPNGDTEIVVCSISVKDHLCMLEIEAPDMQQVITGVTP